MIRLEVPNIKFKQTYLDAVNEIKKRGIDNESNNHYLRKDCFDFEIFVKGLIDKEKNPVEGRVPDTTFWLIDENDAYCGRISLRHRLNEKLDKIGGHIGYDIIPSQRKKGYASLALKLCLQEAKKIGLEKVLLTCDDNNIASIKTIERNGGILENKVTRDNGTLVRRYWCSLE